MLVHRKKRSFFFANIVITVALKRVYIWNSYYRGGISVDAAVAIASMFFLVKSYLGIVFAPTALKDSKILEKLEKLYPQCKIPNAPCIMMVHEQKKSFKCDFCDYSISGKGSLTKHIMSVLERKKSFMCIIQAWYYLRANHCELIYHGTPGFYFQSRFFDGVQFKKYYILII